MEQNVLRMLDGMIQTTEDPEMRRELEHHKRETEQQAKRLETRLKAYDASPSLVKEAGGIMGAAGPERTRRRRCRIYGDRQL